MPLPPECYDVKGCEERVREELLSYILDKFPMLNELLEPESSVLVTKLDVKVIQAGLSEEFDSKESYLMPFIVIKVRVVVVVRGDLKDKYWIKKIIENMIDEKVKEFGRFLHAEVEVEVLQNAPSKKELGEEGCTSTSCTRRRRLR